MHFIYRIKNVKLGVLNFGDGDHPSDPPLLTTNLKTVNIFTKIVIFRVNSNEFKFIRWIQIRYRYFKIQNSGSNMARYKSQIHAQREKKNLTNVSKLWLLYQSKDKRTNHELNLKKKKKSFVSKIPFFQLNLKTEEETTFVLVKKNAQ